MIPTMPNMKPYLYLAAVIALLAAVSGIYIKGRTDGREATEAEYSASLAKANAEKAVTEEAERIRDADIERARLEQLRNLQARIDDLVRAQPDRVVCLSKPARRSVPAATAAPAVANGSAGGEGQGVRAGGDTDRRDITSALLQFAKRCEQDRSAVINWQIRASM